MFFEYLLWIEVWVDVVLLFGDCYVDFMVVVYVVMLVE